MSRQRALHDSEPRVAHLLQEKVLRVSAFVPQIPEVLAELVLEFCKLCGEGVRSPNVVGQRKNLVGNPRPLRYSRGVRVRRSCRNSITGTHLPLRDGRGADVVRRRSARRHDAGLELMLSRSFGQ